MSKNNNLSFLLDKSKFLEKFKILHAFSSVHVLPVDINNDFVSDVVQTD